jgi:hypothetical protein
MELTTNPAMQIKPSLKKSTKRWVTDRARNEQGHVICSCCEKPIRDDQQITINHKQQWQYLRERLVRDPRFNALDFHDQRKAIQNAYNNVGNLEPLHVACHRFVDTGIEASPEEAERLNRKLVSDKQVSFKHYPEPAPELNALEEDTPQPTMAQRTQPNKSKAITDQSQTIDYESIMMKTLLNDTQRWRMRVAPPEVKVKYLTLSEKRLCDTIKKIEEVSRRVPASAKEKEARSKSWDGLVEQKLGLIDQIEFLQRSIASVKTAKGRAPC